MRTPIERKTVAFFTTLKPCDEALGELMDEYNRLADRIEAAWEREAELVEALPSMRTLREHNGAGEFSALMYVLAKVEERLGAL